jgi:hypothetical protein
MRSVLRCGTPVLLLAAVMIVSVSPLAGAASKSAAHTARKKTVTVVETATMHLVKKRGSILRETGTTTGTLAGKVSGRFDVSNIAAPKGTVTFKPNRGGSITVTALGVPDSLGTVAKFHGNMAVKGGSGRYADVTGSGTFTGTVNRDNWNITVRATVKLIY